MSRLVKILSCFAFIFAPSLVASCAGDEDNPTQTTTPTTGIAGSGGVGGTSVTAGSGGIVGGGGSGGVGGTVTPNPWGDGPGRPGSVTSLVRDIPLVQGMSSQNQLLNRGTTNKCTGEGGSAGSSVGGSGGSGGLPAGGSGGTGAGSWCPPTDYVPLTPTLDLSGIDRTSIQLAFPTTPIFQPYDNSIPCGENPEPIEFGRVFVGDCTGVLTEVPAFTEADLTGFFGEGSVFYITTKLTINGKRVSIISGLAIKSAVCGTDLYIVSNGSSKLIRIDLTPDAGYPRTDYDAGEPGLSGLLCTDDGKVLFSTSRIFTAASWTAAMVSDDLTLLVEDVPIRIHSFDPTDESFAVFAEISGGSRVMSTSSVAVETEGTNPITMYMSGIANILTRSVEGDILFGDHLESKVWRISPDGSTATEWFVSDRPFTGMVQAPNGVIYLALNAKTDVVCEVTSGIVIAYRDAQSGDIVDWMPLDDPSYDSLLNSLCNSAEVREYELPIDGYFLGGGNFNDLAVDQEGNLYIEETILNRAVAVNVVFDEPDAGAGGSGSI